MPAILGGQRAADVVGRHQSARRPTTSPTCCPCGCVTCPGRTPSRSHHHAIRSGITLPCVQITGVPPAAAISRTRRRAALRFVRVGLLGQQRLVVDRRAELFGQRFDGLVAAHPVRGVERRRRRTRAAGRPATRPARGRACPAGAFGRRPCIGTCCPPCRAERSARSGCRRVAWRTGAAPSGRADTPAASSRRRRAARSARRLRRSA